MPADLTMTGFSRFRAALLDAIEFVSSALLLSTSCYRIQEPKRVGKSSGLRSRRRARHDSKSLRSFVGWVDGWVGRWVGGSMGGWMDE